MNYLKILPEDISNIVTSYIEEIEYYLNQRKHYERFRFCLEEIELYKFSFDYNYNYENGEILKDDTDRCLGYFNDISGECYCPFCN